MTYTRAQLDAAAIKFAASHHRDPNSMAFFVKYYAEAMEAWDGQGGPSLADWPHNLTVDWKAFLASEYPRYFLNFRTREGENPAFVECTKETFDALAPGGYIVNFGEYRKPRYWKLSGRGTSPDDGSQYLEFEEIITGGLATIYPSDDGENFVAMKVDNPPR